MFKFLVYLFIVYILYKIVTGKVIAKVYRGPIQQRKHNNDAEKEDYNAKPNKNKPTIGEYVDYEEISDKN
jgi:hypothetical protein